MINTGGLKMHPTPKPNPNQQTTLMPNLTILCDSQHLQASPYNPANDPSQPKAKPQQPPSRNQIPNDPGTP